MGVDVAVAVGLRRSANRCLLVAITPLGSTRPVKKCMADQRADPSHALVWNEPTNPTRQWVRRNLRLELLPLELFSLELCSPFQVSCESDNMEHSLWDLVCWRAVTAVRPAAAVECRALCSNRVPIRATE